MTDNNTGDKFAEYSNLCVTHELEWDPTCEFCRESADLCKELYEEQVNKVTYLEHQMMQEGAMIDPNGVLGLKLDVLIGMMLPNKGRAYFDYLFQSRMVSEYESLIGQLGRMKLMQGVDQMKGKKN